MKPSDRPVEGPKNDPMMPLVWIRNYSGASGQTSRVICTTMGSSTDLESAGLRRLLVNACYWGLGMEAEIGQLLLRHFRPRNTCPFEFARLDDVNLDACLLSNV